MQDAASIAEEIVQGKGYVLLPELFTSREISEARLHILNLTTEQPAGRLLKTGERVSGCYFQGCADVALKPQYCSGMTLFPRVFSSEFLKHQNDRQV